MRDLTGDSGLFQSTFAQLTQDGANMLQHLHAVSIVKQELLGFKKLIEYTYKHIYTGIAGSDVALVLMSNFERLAVTYCTNKYP